MPTKTRKKPKSKSPTQRSLSELRAMGAVAQIVERWNQWAKVRQDLFGCIDIVAIVGANIVGIQATSRDNHAARRTKMLAEPRAKAWLDAGGVLEIWSWGKMGGRGEMKRWQCWKEAITVEDFADDAF